jgi:hypothetical protein
MRVDGVLTGDRVNACASSLRFVAQDFVELVG